MVWGWNKGYGRLLCPASGHGARLGGLRRAGGAQGRADERSDHVRPREAPEHVAAALQRIEAGDFGYCIICGEDIAPQRLAFDPAVACCIDCRA